MRPMQPLTAIQGSWTNIATRINRPAKQRWTIDAVQLPFPWVSFATWDNAVARLKRPNKICRSYQSIFRNVDVNRNKMSGDDSDATPTPDGRVWDYKHKHWRTMLKFNLHWHRNVRRSYLIEVWLISIWQPNPEFLWSQRAWPTHPLLCQNVTVLQVRVCNAQL